MSFHPNNLRTETTQGNVGLLLSVYLWRFTGFIVTLLVAFVIASSGFWAVLDTFRGILWLISCFLQICFAVFITDHIYDNGFDVVRAKAKGLYFLYCILNGFTFSLLLLPFLTTIDLRFILFFLGGNASMLASICLYSFLTKQELSQLQSFWLASLGALGWIGVFIFLPLVYFILFDPTDGLFILVCCSVGAFLFAIFMANSVRKIQAFNTNWHEERKKDSNNAVFAALMLQVDFINLFIDGARMLQINHYIYGVRWPYLRRCWYLLDD